VPFWEEGPPKFSVIPHEPQQYKPKYAEFLGNLRIVIFEKLLGKHVAIDKVYQIECACVGMCIVCKAVFPMMISYCIPEVV